MTKAGLGRRIGLFGGSFNPVHHGHLSLAESARQLLHLDEIVFIPTHQNPFKSREDLIPSRDRLAMLRLAIADNPHFSVNPLEIERAGTSYTVDTLRALREEYGPDADFCFLMGADNLKDFPRWREPDTIVEMVRLGIFARPGYRLPELPAAYAGRIEVIPTILIDLSATALRGFLRKGLSPRYLIPDSVLSFIEEKGLYREAVG